MSRETLEALFVARKRLLARIMRSVGSAADGHGRNQTLLVGPRGSGKSHLIALTYYRTMDLIEQGARLQVAWLPEDPWGIVSYAHLLREILDRLDPNSGALNRGAPERELEARLRALVADRGPVVVLAENLDQILVSLGDMGQQRLRHVLQNEELMLFVASTTQLDRVFSDQAHPFYGFFTTLPLKPFTPSQAQKMLAAIARLKGDSDAERKCHEPATMARIKALAHIAGGQPRIWAALSTALSIESADVLVDHLLTRFDDLTPYYQERLSKLSPQQRQIVVELAEADHPLHVAELAARLGLEQRSVGRTMVDLVDLGWVAPVDTIFKDLLDGRRTYYELAEPLARLAFQIKDSRGEPLRVVIDFLTTWFEPNDIRDSQIERSYYESVLARFESDETLCVARSLLSLPAIRVPAVGKLGEVDDALAELAAGGAQQFLALPAPIRAALEDRVGPAKSRSASIESLRLELHAQAQGEFGNTRHPGMVAWLGRAEREVENDPGSLSWRNVLVGWLGRSWRFDEAELVLGGLSEQVEPLVVAQVRMDLADSYRSSGLAHRTIGLLEEALAVRREVLGVSHPDTLVSQNNLASAYRSVGRVAEAIGLYEETLAIRREVLGVSHPVTLVSQNNLAEAYRSVGRVAEAIGLFEEALAVEREVLGVSHPSTLVSQNNLAGAYGAVGRVAEAIGLFEETLAVEREVLGVSHPVTLVSQNNLAYAYRSVGRVVEARHLAAEVLTLGAGAGASGDPVAWEAAAARRLLADLATDDAEDS